MFVSGFYKLSREERLKIIAEDAKLTEEEIKILRQGCLSKEVAEGTVENVVSVFGLPLGFATYFKVNGVERYVPMAIEEPSVIAAASKGAKLTIDGFTAKASESQMIGQIQLIDQEGLKEEIEKHKEDIIEYAKQATKNIEKYGGGFRDFWIREVKGRKRYLLAEFAIATGDAMGANTINSAMEELGIYLSQFADIRLRILSNLATRRITKATAKWKIDTIEEFLEGYDLAVADIYRRTTHNKGIMNGIDAVVIATGNDWRQVEAGAHSYSALTGKPLTRYWKEEEYLVGEIEIPLALGTVGAVNYNPLASINRKIMKVKGSKELAEVVASVGLAQNFSALLALSTEGIQKGHMRLHARSIAIRIGAKGKEIEIIAEELSKQKRFNEELAKEILKELREKN